MSEIIPMKTNINPKIYSKKITKALGEEPIVKSFNSEGKTFYIFESCYADTKKLAKEFQCPMIYFRETKYDDETVYIWDIDEEILINDINNVDN